MSEHATSQLISCCFYVSQGLFSPDVLRSGLRTHLSDGGGDMNDRAGVWDWPAPQGLPFCSLLEVDWHHVHAFICMIMCIYCIIILYKRTVAPFESLRLESSLLSGPRAAKELQ